MQTTDEKFMALAVKVSEHSTDPNRKVGVVIADENGAFRVGFNEFPIGVKRDPIKDRQVWTVHAEIRAISNAAKQRFRTDQCTLYTTYFPCATCAGAIINAGIIRVVAPLPDLNHHRWGQSWKTAIEMFKETGVQVSYRKIDG